MKGLILSGGKGTRLRPLTYTRAKQLLPLANKPVLFLAIESLIAAGIRELGIVVGDTGQEIREAVGDGSRWGPDVHVQFLQQEAPLGLAHAVLTAEEFLGDDKFIMFLGDNLIGEPLSAIVSAFSSPDCDYNCRILLKTMENPSEFGVAELREAAPGAEPTIKRLIEKPRIPPSNLALVGVYCFDSHIFEAARSIRPSSRGELEITDAIQWLIDNGYSVRPHILDKYWIDTGKMEDVLAANRLVLSGIGHSVAESAVISADSVLQGDVTVEPGAQILNSIVRGPAIIGERTVLRDAYIGPFTSVYHDVVIEGSEIEYCIVLEHCRITNVGARIEASLVGRYVEIYASAAKPRGHKLMLGDYSRLALSSD